MSIGTLLFELVGLLFIVLLNGFFVAAEYALVKSRKSRIEELVRDGNPNAVIVRELQRSIDLSVSGSQVGITFCTMALGWIGQPAVHEVVVRLLNLISGSSGFQLPMGADFVISFLLLTLVHVVIGEQVAKIVSLSRWEAVVLRVARPFQLYLKILWPVHLAC